MSDQGHVCGYTNVSHEMNDGGRIVRVKDSTLLCYSHGDQNFLHFHNFFSRAENAMG